MKIKFCFVVSLIFFMLSCVVIYGECGELNNLSNPVAYDHIQLVHTWIPTYCKDKSNMCSKLSQVFQLHGLWPANAVGNTVGPCLSTAPVLSSVYNTLGNPLVQAWPSLSSRWTNQRFWDNEWIKHGSCSSNTLPALNYFTSGITQTNKINIQRMLTNGRPNSIQPSDSTLYTQSAIEKAISDQINGKPNIYVSCLQIGNSYYLYEIHICLDKTATNYISCPGSTSLRGCPGNKNQPLIKYITKYDSDAYDHIQLVHTWIPTYCKDTNNRCTKLSPIFQLHGLWPADDYGNTIGPCFTSIAPDLRSVYSTLGRPLVQAWPSLTLRWTNQQFWDHEWTEHGICSSDTVPALNYFSSGITQTNKINIQKMLKDARPSIQPSDTALRTQSAIEKAISDQIQGNPNIYVSCRKFGNSYYLYEIYICLDKTAAGYISCPTRSLLRGCPRDKNQPLIKYITVSGSSVEESSNELIGSS